MLDKDSNASRLIDKLESSDLTKRVQCLNDRRQVDITITKRGLRLLEEIDPEINQMTDNVINLSTEEAIMMNNLLDKMRKGPENNTQKDLVEKAERSN
jgi:DNA-binding MarR family transcriptional regulator